jgi:hypothetical protein
VDPDILDATVQFKDTRGYQYVGMSDSWKRMCLDLPCSKRVKVPPVYKQQSLTTTIDGQEIVIQAWKGNCPKAYREMPGGIGGEVGIYRRIPGKEIPDVLALPRLNDFPANVRPKVKAALSKLIKELVETAESGVDLWWPYPELDAQIEMRLLHPDRDVELFHANPSEAAGGYWMSRWMHYWSYAKYVARELFHLRRVPLNTFDYRMQFSVKGHRFEWGAPSSPIRPL